MREDFDAVIIGGGPAGATAAALLADAGWSVAVVEKTRFPRRKVCGECISATNLSLLRALGVKDAFLAIAGPPLRHVGLCAGDDLIATDFPSFKEGDEPWGRALGREHFDALLLARAGRAGACLLQPWRVLGVHRRDGRYVCSLESAESSEHGQLRAPLLIAAHGSWEPGSLATQPARQPPAASDLFAFKADFSNSRLPGGLVAVLAFPGGYGGMVLGERGRMTLAFCVCRDAMRAARRRLGGESAAEAALAHVERSCRGVRPLLEQATQVGPWLSCGPIRPGFRGHCRDGIWLLGNAAAEPHPIVGEGISVAIQSAFMLCECLIAHRRQAMAGRSWEAFGADFARRWRGSFTGRMRVAALLAQLAMRPVAMKALLPFFRRRPELLALCTRASGKTHLLPLRQDAGVCLPA